MEIQFTTRIFKEGRSYVAHGLELDVSSYGGSKDKALKNLKLAVRLFLEEVTIAGVTGNNEARAFFLGVNHNEHRHESSR